MALFLYLLLTCLLAFIVRELGKTRDQKSTLSIPTVRFGVFLPNSFNRLIFFIAGPKLIHHGYNKYKDIPYRVLKADGDLVVLPRRYLSELRHLPPSKLSSLDAQFENVLGKYTKVLVESHLPASTVSRRLIPRLSSLVPSVIDELNRAFEKEVPECNEDWASVNPYNMMLRLLARATSRLFAGEEVCRNENLPDIVSSYTINMGITIIVLRPFPEFIRPLVAKFLPSVRNLEKLMKHVKKDIFVPIIKARMNAVEGPDPAYEKPDDFLQWMLDLSDNARDREPGFFAHNLFIIMNLAVIHTSTMALTQTLYDLILHPACLDTLRSEIKSSLVNGWKNGTLQEFLAMRRLDSFMRESQRFNPTSEVSFHRIVKVPLHLSDGLHLPPGIHICFPSGPMSHDPSIIPDPDPEVFDPFRWSDGPVQKSMVTIGEDNMHFGYGRQACPGRAFASAAMKMVLSRLLLEYEVRFEEEGRTARPRNVVNGEQILPSLTTRVLVRRVGCGGE